MALLGPRAGCPKMCLNSILTILNLNHLRNMWLPTRRRWGREGVGVWGYQMQLFIYKMDRQQGPTV